MTSTISSTSRDRRLLPTFVARVGVLRLGQAMKPQFAAVEAAITSRDVTVDVTNTPRYTAAGERKP